MTRASAPSVVGNAPLIAGAAWTRSDDDRPAVAQGAHKLRANHSLDGDSILDQPVSQKDTSQKGFG